MSSHSQTFAIAFGVTALLCVCLLALALAVVGGAYFLVAPVGGPLAPAGGPMPTAVRTAIPSAPPPAATAPPTQSASEQDRQMDQIEQQVMAIRGLTASQPVPRQLMTTAELREYNLKEFEKDYTRDEARDDTIALAAFGLLDPSFQLYDFYIDLYSEDILGFYDPDAGKLSIITDRGHMGAVERVTFAHEFQHALQDQNYGFEALGLSDEGWEKDAERAAAIQALIEGEATLLEEEWQRLHFTKADWDDYYANAFADPDSAYFRAPKFLQKDFYFPYSQGYDFVNRLFERGGWTAVDAAYRQPPVSTEMILHPEKYDAGEAPQVVAAVVLTDTLGAGWQQVDTGVMGEWYTSLILEQHIGEAEAQKAAAGWGGDHYTVSYDEAAGQTVAVWHTVWDTSGDMEEFVDAFKKYGDARFGTRAVVGGGSLCWFTTVSTCLYLSPRATLWIYAPDKITLDKLRQAANF